MLDPDTAGSATLLTELAATCMPLPSANDTAPMP